MIETLRKDIAIMEMGIEHNKSLRNLRQIIISSFEDDRSTIFIYSKKDNDYKEMSIKQLEDTYTGKELVKSFKQSLDIVHNKVLLFIELED